MLVTTNSSEEHVVALRCLAQEEYRRYVAVSVAHNVIWVRYKPPGGSI